MMDATTTPTTRATPTAAHPRGAPRLLDRRGVHQRLRLPEAAADGVREAPREPTSRRRRRRENVTRSRSWRRRSVPTVRARPCGFAGADEAWLRDDAERDARRAWRASAPSCARTSPAATARRRRRCGRAPSLCCNLSRCRSRRRSPPRTGQSAARVAHAGASLRRQHVPRRASPTKGAMYSLVAENKAKYRASTPLPARSTEERRAARCAGSRLG